MPRIPDLLDEREWSPAELSAAALDGELYAVGGAWRPVDLPATPAARAASIAPIIELVGEEAVAYGATAAWIWGAATAEPTLVDVAIRHDLRLVVVAPRLRVHQVHLTLPDLSPCGRLVVTSPLRTAIDLVRDDTAGRRRQSRVSRGSVGSPGWSSPPHCAGREHLHGKHRGIARARTLTLDAGQTLLTR